MANEVTRTPISETERTRLRSRAAETRSLVTEHPAPNEILTPDEMADGAPFYFELRACVVELKKAREAAGLTVPQVAERMGVAPEELARLEAGLLTNPSWKMLGNYSVIVGRTLRLSV